MLALGHCSRVYTLHLDDNSIRLSSLQLTNDSQVSHLSLSNNQLTSLDVQTLLSMGTLSQCVYLDVSNNKIVKPIECQEIMMT